MTVRRVLIAVLGMAAIAACSPDEPQPENRTPGMADRPSFEGADAPYVAAGWKPGDARSWDEQMSLRVRNQNEYIRVK